MEETQMTEIVESVSRLDPKPGEALLVKVKIEIDGEEQLRIGNELKAALPGVVVFLAGPSADIEVIRRTKSGAVASDIYNNKIVPEEVNSGAVGLVIDDFDFGMAIMTATNPLDLGRYFALRASAEMLSLEGTSSPERIRFNSSRAPRLPLLLCPLAIALLLLEMVITGSRRNHPA